jgi:hypothetical protein
LAARFRSVKYDNFSGIMVYWFIMSNFDGITYGKNIGECYEYYHTASPMINICFATWILLVIQWYWDQEWGLIGINSGLIVDQYWFS